MLADERVREYLKYTKNYASFYLMFSYLYYSHDISLISDHLFDEICKTLDERWDEIEHVHKQYIDRGSLKAGTGYYISELPAEVLDRISGACAQFAIEAGREDIVKGRGGKRKRRKKAIE